MNEISINRDPAELRRLIDSLGVAAFVIDVDSHEHFRLAAINARHEELTGMKHELVAGRSVDHLLEREMANKVKARYRRCVQERVATDYREVLDLPVGRTYWHTTLVPFMDCAGNVTRLLGTAHEISQTVHLELEARYQSTVMSAYLDESPDGILVVDAQNRIKTWNTRFLEIWRIPATIMEGRDGDSALAAVREQLEDADSFVQRVNELYSSLEEEEHGTRIPMKDGRILERYSRGLHGPEKAYWGRIWFYRDVTEREQMTEKLIRASRTDPLTGAANRRAFMDALDDGCNRARRYGHSLSVLMMDMDHFKKINDRYGHAAGDAVLRQFVEVVSPELRASDCFARIGGEEFAVLLPESGLDAARGLAERLRRNVANLRFDGRDGDYGVTVSIGVAELNESDRTVDHLLTRADRCLYTAKHAGRNRVHA